MLNKINNYKFKLVIILVMFFSLSSSVIAQTVVSDEPVVNNGEYNPKAYTRYSEQSYKTDDGRTLTFTKDTTYNKYDGKYKTKVCSKGTSLCFTKNSVYSFPTKLYVNSEYQNYETSISDKIVGSAYITYSKNGEEINAKQYKSYYCEFSSGENSLKLQFNVDATATIYFNGKSVSGDIYSSYVNNKASMFLVRTDNVSDYDSSSGNCPGYVYYHPTKDLVFTGNKPGTYEPSTTTYKGFTFALFTNLTNPESYSDFTYLRNVGAVDTIMMPLTGTNSKTNTTGQDVYDATGCGIFGTLLSEGGIVDEIFGLVQVLLVAGLLVLGMVDFMKPVMSGEADAFKKAGKKFTNRIIIAVLIILMPILVDFVIIKLFPTITESCLNNI